MQKARKTLKLTVPQTCMTANFHDAACDYPKETFAQITKRMFGTKDFPRTKNAELFKWECPKAFNLGRHK